MEYSFIFKNTYSNNGYLAKLREGNIKFELTDTSIIFTGVTPKVEAVAGSIVIISNNKIFKIPPNLYYYNLDFLTGRLSQRICRDIKKQCRRSPSSFQEEYLNRMLPEIENKLGIFLEPRDYFFLMDNLEDLGVDWKNKITERAYSRFLANNDRSREYF